eukprot:751681-Hanusia_phi.AAC.1
MGKSELTRLRKHTHTKQENTHTQSKKEAAVASSIHRRSGALITPPGHQSAQKCPDTSGTRV